MPLPVCLGPIRLAEKFILVGDHHHWIPKVHSKDASQMGFEASLFEQLMIAQPHAVFKLMQQFRMNKDIQQVANVLLYHGELSCPSEDIAIHRLPIPDSISTTALHSRKLNCSGMADCWMHGLLDACCSVAFVDTDSISPVTVCTKTSIMNVSEAIVIEFV